MAGLQIKNLCKKFSIKEQEFLALNNINLSIDEGSFVTIVGRSGCGKTTLLRTICGLDKETSGTINFNEGKNLNSSKKVGIVFQEPRLMPWLTVEENIAFSLKKNKDKEYVRNNVQKYLRILGLEKFKNTYPAQISGGMAQRTALGRTLCYDPDIILMDEPLGALDAFNRRKLQNEFINILLENKKTIIFVTHDVEEAIYLGQKVIVMDKGSIIKEVPICMDYYRNPASKEFLEIREGVFKLIINNY